MALAIPHKFLLKHSVSRLFPEGVDVNQLLSVLFPNLILSVCETISLHTCVFILLATGSAYMWRVKIILKWPVPAWLASGLFSGPASGPSGLLSGLAWWFGRGWLSGWFGSWVRLFWGDFNEDHIWWEKGERRIMWEIKLSSTHKIRIVVRLTVHGCITFWPRPPIAWADKEVVLLL